VVEADIVCGNVCVGYKLMLVNHDVTFLVFFAVALTIEAASFLSAIGGQKDIAESVLKRPNSPLNHPVQLIVFPVLPLFSLSFSGTRNLM